MVPSAHTPSGPLIHLSPCNPTLYALVLPHLQRGQSNKQQNKGSSSAEKTESFSNALDESISDLGGTRYRLFVTVSSDNNNHILIVLNVSIHGWDDIKGEAIPSLKEVFGDESFMSRDDCGGESTEGTERKSAQSVQHGFDFAVKIDCSNLPNNQNAESCAECLSRIRVIVLGAPLRNAFQKLVQNGNDGNKSGAEEKKTIFRLPIQRPVTGGHGGDCHVACFDDRVTIVFTVYLPDETERALAYVYLQSFTEAPKSAHTPICDFRRGNDPPPLEISNVVDTGRTSGGIVGYLSFTFCETHIAEDAIRENAIEMLVTLMSYLEYHIKASKSFIHGRMRLKKEDLMKVLNRASF